MIVNFHYHTRYVWMTVVRRCDFATSQ